MRILSKVGRKHRGSPATRGRLIGKRHISERPAHVELRRHIGHWEGDTVMGADQRHCVLTLVERVTGYVVIKKLSARNKSQAATALSQAIRQLKGRVKTITLDNGTEFHDYARVEQAHGVKFYFATPYHSWERGTNENTNGLIRQYLPKGMCMRHITQAHCSWIANQLNNRPRERLGFKTPSEALARS
jgi:IS30 family transposase